MGIEIAAARTAFPKHPAVNIALADSADNVVAADGSNKLVAGLGAALPGDAVAGAVLLPFRRVNAFQANLAAADPQAVSVNGISATGDRGRKRVVLCGRPPKAAVMPAENEEDSGEG